MELWIPKRIGGEVELRKDPSGRVIIVLTPLARPIVAAKFNAMVAGKPPPARVAEGPRDSRIRSSAPAGPRSVSKDVWLSALPSTELTGAEAALRQSLLDWLRDWPHKRPSNRPPSSPALLSDALHDPVVQRHRADLLPPTVPISDWIDFRIGGEIEIRRDERGQVEIMLRGAGPSGSKRRRGGDETQERAKEKPGSARNLEAHAGGSSAEAFFSRLPADELSADELALREAVLGFIEQAGTDAPLLKDAAKDTAVAACRATLLPPEVPLRTWLDHRIGGEIEILRHEVDNHFLIRLRKPVTEGEVVAEAPEDSKFVNMSKDRFFATLPGDSFTPNEENLRDELLRFLDSHTGKEHLTACFSFPAVKTARVMTLPKTVPLREWIERRMGGELEVAPDPKGQMLLKRRVLGEPQQKKSRAK